MDARGRLESDPFDWQVQKSGNVRILRGGREVCVVGGAAARKLTDVLDRGDDERIQHALARVSGHYKHGNER